MSFLRRLLGEKDHSEDPRAATAAPDSALQPVVLSGGWNLEVVGESYRQAELWRLIDPSQVRQERIRQPVIAVLLPESDHPQDDNAVSIWIAGLMVGYLAREDAAVLHSGLLHLQARHGRPMALNAVIAGGAGRSLGVFLDFDPAEFGVDRQGYEPRRGPAGGTGSRLVAGMGISANAGGSLRTGLSEAIITDSGDDSYDLSWLGELPVDDVGAITKLRHWLSSDPDPIDRHYQYCELESRLYRSRDAFASALSEYDQTCRAHDAEMDGIRAALMAKFGTVPVLETYRQAAIRHQKAGQFVEALWWAERGLQLYGDTPARVEAVVDLKQRAEVFRRKLEPKSAPRRDRPTREDDDAEAQKTEELRCTVCGTVFVRVRTRGRKPSMCPTCAGQDAA